MKKLSAGTVFAVGIALSSSALAGRTFTLTFVSGSTVTFHDTSTGTTVLNPPSSCSGTVSPSYPSGTYYVSSCTDTTTSITAAGKASTAHLSATSGTGEFSTSDYQMSFKPDLKLRIVANDASFDCSATFSGRVPEFSGTMMPSLPLPPPDFEGTLSLASSISVPDFVVTGSCSSNYASALNAQFDYVSAADLDAELDE